MRDVADDDDGDENRAASRQMLLDFILCSAAISEAAMVAVFIFVCIGCCGG